MMKKVVREVVTDIAKYSPRKHSGCDVPIPIEHSVGKLPKWNCKGKE